VVGTLIGILCGIILHVLGCVAASSDGGDEQVKEVVGLTRPSSHGVLDYPRRVVAVLYIVNVILSIYRLYQLS